MKKITDIEFLSIMINIHDERKNPLIVSGLHHLKEKYSNNLKIIELFGFLSEQKQLLIQYYTLNIFQKLIINIKTKFQYVFNIEDEIFKILIQLDNLFRKNIDLER
jgi:hypothetical protein